MSIVPTASFEWSSDDSVVVRSQAALAVYQNAAGAIVIRQEMQWDDDSDVFIVVQPENAPALARAIMREAGSGNGGQLALPAPTSAAERQRRYRERKRHGDVTRDGDVNG